MNPLIPAPPSDSPADAWTSYYKAQTAEIEMNAAREKKPETNITRIVTTVTILVSIGGLITSLIQANVTARKALDDTSAKRAEFENLREQQKREWGFKALDFVLTHKDVLLAPASPEQKQLLSVMWVGFPNEVMSELSNNLQMVNVNPDAKSAIAEIQKRASPRITVAYEKVEPALLKQIKTAIEKAGYNFGTLGGQSAPTVSDVRYYFDDDQPFATELQELVKGAGLPNAILRSRTDDKRSVHRHTPGEIEIWIGSKTH